MYVIIVVLLTTFPISSSYAQSYYFSVKTSLGGGTVLTTFMDSLLTYRARKKFSSVYNRFQAKLWVWISVFYMQSISYTSRDYFMTIIIQWKIFGWSTIYSNCRERHLWKQNKIFPTVAISPRFVVKTLLYDPFLLYWHRCRYIILFRPRHQSYRTMCGILWWSVQCYSDDITNPSSLILGGLISSENGLSPIRRQAII